MKNFSVVLSVVAMVLLLSVSCFAQSAAQVASTPDVVSNFIDCDIPGGCLDIEDDINWGPDGSGGVGSGATGGTSGGSTGGDDGDDGGNGNGPGPESYLLQQEDAKDNGL